jgi:hypothetical protein
MIQVRLDSDFGVNFLLSSFTLLSITPNPIVVSSWIWQENSRGIGLCWGKVSDESEFEKNMRYRSEQTVWFLLFTSFWLMDFQFGKDPFPTRMW